MNGRVFDAIVIGAGPYGLSAAAHLLESGRRVHVVGRPMSFWREHMPKGMLLRSPWSASHISSPRSTSSLDEFQRFRRVPIQRPIPLADFVAYGDWFQKRAVPELDQRRVERVDVIDDGLRVHLEDGEPLESRRVVVAGGIESFAWRPPEFGGLPRDLVSHSNEHVDLGQLAGRRVAVIGGGQSALESGVLLQESGADVRVFMRARQLRWMGRATRDGIIGRLLFDATDVGPGLISHVVARPLLWQRLPPFARRRITKTSLAAGVAVWLRKRLESLPIEFGRGVLGATDRNGRVLLLLDDGTSREFDHVLLGTGYRVDVRRYDFLGQSLASEVLSVGGYPVLDGGFQSSVRGLHFLGAPAVHSFGPLLRFVSGTDFAARSLTRSIESGATEPTGEGRADQGLILRSQRRMP